MRRTRSKAKTWKEKKTEEEIGKTNPTNDQKGNWGFEGGEKRQVFRMEFLIYRAIEGPNGGPKIKNKKNVTSS